MLNMMRDAHNEFFPKEPGRTRMTLETIDGAHWPSNLSRAVRHGALPSCVGKCRHSE